MTEIDQLAPEQAAMPLLSARGLGRRGATEADWLFRDISFEISPGDRLALVGPTGSGKSLVLRALALLDPLDEGEVHWRGRPISNPEVPEFRSQSIYLQQRSPVVEGTVEENLRIPYQLDLRQNLALPLDKATTLLERLGKDDSFLTTQTANLSGGERQIVALLRALLTDPTVLLLDEPSAALDPTATMALESLVESWFSEAPRQRAYVWVSHDPAQASRVGSSLIRLEGGLMEID